MYIFALVLILMLINWLFFSSYYSLYKILFFEKEGNNTNLRRIILINLSSFFYYGFIYNLIGFYFYTFPVINGLSNSYHPCQTLADLMTVKEYKKKFKGIKIAWVGDGNNVCNSLIFGCSKTQTKISIATPKGFEPDPEVVKKASKNTTVDLTTDPKYAVKDANVVMTDTFMSIHTSDSKQAEKFLPSFQVNQSLMVKAKKDAIFMHCLPAKRGQEVTSEVIDGAQSAVWTQAENRLHTQKALLISLLGI